MELTRRQFLKVMTSSAAGAVVFSGCAAPELELLVQSPVRMPEDLVTGLDNWYATVCRQCPSGCGIIVRVMEGRAKKIEGNPDHPLNRGKLCARGQAGVQALYHPDRLRGPLRRIGERGNSQFQEVSYDEALSELVARLGELQNRGEADTVLLITEPIIGHRALVVERFIKAYGGQHIAHEVRERTILRTVMERMFGQSLLPELNLENTQYLISFGANFLETWLSPVRYGRGYGEFRQGRLKRGTLVQVEPRLSTTAANADEWVPIKPGTEGIMALSMAYVMISEGLANPATAQAMTGGQGARALEAFRPQEAEKVTGVPAQRVIELARNFALKQPSLALGGDIPASHTNGLFNVSAIMALNFLADNIGKPGGLILNPAPPLPQISTSAQVAPFVEWQRLVQRLESGRPRPVNLLMVQGANPVHGLPGALRFKEALSKVPYIVSFSSFIDDTAAFADLILPEHVPFEDWGDDIPDPGSGYQVIGFQQPVVNPIYSTQSFPDMLLKMAEGLGGNVKQALPWATFRDVLREGAKELFELKRGSVKAEDFEHFWVGVLQRGGWWDPQAKAPGPPPPPTLSRQPVLPTFAGSQEEYPFHLIVFPSLSLGDGNGAHLPWLQATPDPMTTVLWQTWVEVNPKTAQEMGLKEGDIVAVDSPQGTIEVPVYVHPGIAPDIVAIPAGQGHTTGRVRDEGVKPLPFLHPTIPRDALGFSSVRLGPVYGRYAEGRGANPFTLVAPLTDHETGALAWGATRVGLRTTGRSMRLPKIEGVVPALEPHEAGLVQVTRE